MNTPTTSDIWDILNIVNDTNIVDDKDLNAYLQNSFPKTLQKTAISYTVMLKTIFEMAIYQNQYNLLHTLLQKGFPPNICGDWNTTPLMWASYFNQPAIIKLLKAYGADSTIRSFSGLRATDFLQKNIIDTPEARFIEERKKQINAQVNAGVFKIGTTTSSAPVNTKKQTTRRQIDNGRGVDEVFKKIKAKERTVSISNTISKNISK